MSGRRLIIGVISMGLIVPGIIFMILHLSSPAAFFAIAAISFFGWGVTEVVASILAHPRLRDRSPSKALRNWDSEKDAEKR